MDTQTILGLTARHLLTKGAGVLVAAGYLQGSQTEQFVGAGVFLLGIAWSIWQKAGQAKVAAQLARLKSTMPAAVIMFALLALGGLDHALAADLSVKAPVKPTFSFQGYPVDSGLYFGVNTALAGGSANGASSGTVNSNTGKLISAEGDIGLNLGYVWARQGQPIWYGIEGTLDWANLNAQSTGLSVTGPLNFEVIGILGAPWDQVSAFLPNFRLGTLPGLPQLPTGVTAGPGMLYLFAGGRGQDISTQFQTGTGKAWAFSLLGGVGTRWNLNNHSAFDVRVEYISPTNQACFVNGINQGCGGLGSGVLARSSILF